MKCKPCDGTGMAMCETCSGEGSQHGGGLKCSSCGGKGLITCPACEGKGKVSFFRLKKAK